MAIGIFDTGIGGLAVLLHLRNLGFQGKIMYFNDDGRFPYGEKDPEERLGYALEVAQFLQDKASQSISISCNTVVTFAKDAIAKRLNINPFDVISAAINNVKSLEPSEAAKILVIGSKVTCSSKIYSSNILNNDTNTQQQVFEVPFNDLIYTIEDNIDSITHQDIQSVVHQTIHTINPDVLVLACSHYSLVGHYFRSLYPNINIIDPTFELAKQLLNHATSKNNGQTQSNANIIFYTGKDDGILTVLNSKGIDNLITEKVHWN